MILTPVDCQPSRSSTTTIPGRARRQERRPQAASEPAVVPVAERGMAPRAVAVLVLLSLAFWYALLSWWLA